MGDIGTPDERWVFDPSRYEGHTPGPWVPERFKSVRSEADCGVFAMPWEGHAYSIVRAPRYVSREQWERDSRLIADAPHILAEAVRLRAENERLREVLVYIRDMPNYDQDNEQRLRAIARRALADMEGVCDG